MSIHTDLASLQEHDTSLDERRIALRQVDLRLAEESIVREARAAVRESEAQLRDLDSRQREVEHGLKEVVAKVTREEARLYDGSITSSRELSALQKEVASLREDQARREEALLGVLATAEEAGAHHAEALRQLRAIEAERKAEAAQLRSRRAILDGEIAGLEAKAAEVSERIPPATLSLYQRLRKRHHGKGIAHIERGTCGGCRIALPSNVVAKVRAGELVQCPTCERILHGAS